MDKNLMELKKRYKKEECNISKIYACYVNLEGEQKCSIHENFLVMKDNKENDFFKFLDIQKKNISNKLSYLPMKEDSEIKKLLNVMCNGELDDENLIKVLVEQLIACYLKDSIGNFMISFIYDSYDVPARTSDGIKLDESEEVYSYIMCSICPVNPSKAGLSYLEKENTIGSRVQDQIVDAPVIGFLYPSFVDKSSDDTVVSYLYKSDKNLFPSIITDIFEGDVDDIEIEEPVKKEKEVKDSYEEPIIPDNLPDYLQKEREEIFGTGNDSIPLEEQHYELEKEEDITKVEESKEETVVHNYEYNEEEMKGFCMSSDDEEVIEEETLKDDDLIENIEKIVKRNKKKSEIQIINGKKCLVVMIED